MEIYYINSNGDRIDFLSDTIAIQNIETLFGQSRSYTSVASMKFGGKIKKFNKGIQEKEFTLSIVAGTEEEFSNICKNIEDIFDYDVLLQSPGKLYVNDFYLSCYIYQSEYKEYEDLFYITDKKYVLISEYPNWIKEHKYTITDSVSNTNAVVGYAVAGKAVLNTKNTSAASSSTTSIISNRMPVPCHFNIKMHGYANNLTLKIGENVYRIDKELIQNEYVEIDSIRNICVKKMRDGAFINVFGYSDFENYIYKKIAPGINTVEWSATTPVEITIYEERGEPLWT